MLSKAQAKKLKTRYEEEKRKEKAAAEREVNWIQNQSENWFIFSSSKEKERAQRDENLKKAKEITITEDASLPKPKVVCSILYLKMQMFDEWFLVEN